MAARLDDVLEKSDRETMDQLDKFRVAYLKAMANRSRELPQPLDPVKLWRLLIRVSNSSPTMLLPILFNHFALYRAVVPEFSSDPPEMLTKYLDDVKNRSKGFSKRTQVAKILIRILPFIEDEEAVAVIDAAVEIVANHLAQKHELPKEFLETFADVQVEDFTEKTFELVEAYFRDGFYGEDENKSNATIAIFGEMCLAFSGIDDKMQKQCEQLVFDCLDPENSRDRKLVGCMFLHKYAYWYEHEDEDSRPKVEKLMDVMCPLLMADDISLSLMAHKAVKTLIKVGVFRNDEAIEELLGLVDEYSGQMRPQLFKLLHAFVAVVEEEKDSIESLTPIRNFVVEQLQMEKQNVNVVGLCIDTLADLMSLDAEFVGDSWEIGWNKCQEIFAKKHASEYPLISSFLVGVCRLHPEKIPETRDGVMKMVDNLSKDNSGNISSRLDMAIDIAELIKLGVLESPPAILGAFAIKGVSSSAQQDAIRACAVILEALPVISEKTASLAFDKISRHALQANEINVFEFFVKTMYKLFKRFDIKGKPVDQFMATIVHGNMTHFPGKPAACFSQAAKFVNLFIKKYPEHFGKILSVYDQYIPQVAPPALALFLAPYNAAMKYAGSNMNFQKVWEVGSSSLLKCQFLHFSGALASIECLGECFARSPQHCGPTEAVVAHCMQWVEKADVKYQHKEFMSPCLEMLPSISYLFFLAAANDREIDPSVLKTLINFMPYPPEVKLQSKLLDCLADMIVKPKFKFLRTRACTVFLELLVLDTESFDMFKFPPAVVTKLKDVVRKLVGQNPEARKKVMSHMINAKRDQEALSELLD